MCSAAPSHAVELPVSIPAHAQAARREASLLITPPCDWMEDLFTALDQVGLLSGSQVPAAGSVWAMLSPQRLSESFGLDGIVPGGNLQKL